MYTKEVHVIVLPTQKGVLKKTVGGVWLVEADDRFAMGYHLYFVTDEQMKYGELGITWNLSNALILQYPAGMDKRKSWSKIVATTNPDLNFKPTSEIPYLRCIPKIPHDFIETFVQSQGTINVVKLEVTRSYPLDHEYILTNTDGTVIISQPIQPEKTYTKKEVIEILSKFGGHIAEKWASTNLR